MSNSDFFSAICRRNTVEDATTPKYTSLPTRGDHSVFQCVCDGGVYSKRLIHSAIIWWVGASAIRTHDEVVSLLARLFRSLLLDAIVEPIRLFADTSVEGCGQRPDILRRNPRGFGRQIILDFSLLKTKRPPYALHGSNLYSPD